MTIKEFLRNNERSQDQLKKLTDPLKDSLGIDAFWHGVIKEDGQLYSNCNYIDSVFHFWENQCYHDMGFYISPTRLKSGYFLLDYDPSYEKYQDLVREKYPIHHPLLFVRKENNKSVNLFGFMSKKRNPVLPSLYLNNLPILNSYIDYYLEEGKSMIKRSENHSIDLVDLRGKDTFYESKYSEESLVQKERNLAMLSKMGVNAFILRNASQLTFREKQVLNIAVEGKTSTQSGEELGLSPRTVQFYLENVKDKLGICTRKELLHYGRLLKMYGILP